MVRPVMLAVDGTRALREISAANPGLDTALRVAFVRCADVAFTAKRVSPRFSTPRLTEAQDLEEG